MNLPLKTISISIVCAILVSCTSARITFTGDAPEKYKNDTQPLSIYACNNTTISHSIKWGKKNHKKIPFGHHRKDGKEYFISKYYIASPPLPNKFVAKEPLILGVLSEDHFALENAKQNVNIFMNYRKLKPIHLAFIPVSYTNHETGSLDCIEQNINKIPINIRCPEFEYTDHEKKITGKSTGLGKGIGQLKRTEQGGILLTEGDLFIPIDITTKKALQNCTVEIVNDIMLEHQIYFGTAEKHDQKIDLTGAYETYQLTKEPMSLYCKARPENEPATGCNPITPNNN